MENGEKTLTIGESRVRKYAHDVRNPLTSISCFAELLIESGELRAEDHEHAEFIFSETQRLSGMLEELFAELLPKADTQN